MTQLEQPISTSPGNISRHGLLGAAALGARGFALMHAAAAAERGDQGKPGDGGKWIGMGRWLATATLLGLLVFTLWVSYGLWTMVVATVPAFVWLLLAIGGVLCIVLGGGLMALVFYSNRMGYDEPPRLVGPSDRSPTT
jgi:hypothetical protein